MTDLPYGVLAALVTPFTDALEPDTKTLIAHGRWLLNHGCNGLVMLATAGEANSLSLRQRLGMIEAAGAAGLPLSRMIIGGGSCALDEAVTLTKAIAAAGTAGVLLLPPFYYRDTGEEALFRFYASLIERAGAPGLRAVLHHRPQASGSPITDALITRLQGQFGAVIAGVQNGAGDWATTKSLIERFPGLAIFSGTERFLLETLRAGGQGCISATINITAPLAGAVFQKRESGEADEMQKALTALRETFDHYPTPQAQKEILAQMTDRAGWRTALPPLLPLPTDSCDALRRQLDALPPWLALVAAHRSAG
ncbi:MAG TPA: dihydrodipicolinate synthase family protein [Stellaceae bacterium]|jgi:4-hydroxy-tetrahydrodipicolinate synthase|nr:dihydrodipicolinate synthase family protein [Stellaceae bacterium]